ncbi:MFS transporter [Moraxella haemolytica]|uniref:AmpG family muropeptide MFS transporter n=1 Tax=Moraxella haemolytica TaxID=2904119 RepID=UPI0025432259|nr:MFS transporter [Moraxella sp. ZY171148]WII96039.1 MFS transporter [Moraxella sp. ZY171148]
MADTMQHSSPWLVFKQTYLTKNALIMLMLGFSAGLPYFLVFSTLSMWLVEAQIDKSKVTMFAWAGLAYSFKFLWAPLVDSLSIPFLHRYLGKRRSWLLVAQLMIILAVCLMALTSPNADSITSLEMMALFAVLLAFSSASQDIVIDAYRIEVVPKSMQTAFSALYVFGYRLGLIISGAGALYLATYFGSTEEMYQYIAWKQTYFVMALVMGVGVLTTLSANEPHTQILTPIKQKLNDKIMGWYALVALVPMGLYGLWYLLNQICERILQVENHPFVISEAVANFASMYGIAMLIPAPIALIFLLFNQPKMKSVLTNQAVVNKQDAKNNLRLVMLFVVCMVGFIFAFRIFGDVIIGDVKHSNLVGFLLESVRFIISVLVAAIVAHVLIKIKLVPKEVAAKNWIEPILEFFDTYGKKAVLILALIGLYRISDIVAGNIANIFYQDMGYTKVQIADASKLVGLTMSILGGFLGGFIAQRMKIIAAMMVGAILAAVTNLLFIVLFYEPTAGMLYVAVIADNLAGGLASAVFVAFLSVLTSIRFTAVQYALFSSLMTLSPKILGGYSGSIVEATSYPTFFLITCLLGVPVLFLVYLVGKYIKLGDEKFTLKDES